MVDYQQEAADDDSLPGLGRRVRRLRELEARPAGSRGFGLTRALLGIARGR